MTKKPNLGVELKRRFRMQGYTMARVAKELGLYENSLRSWIRRNRYPRRELERLIDFAKMGHTLTDLEGAYAYSLAGSRNTYSRNIDVLLQADTVELPDAFDAVERGLKENFKGRQPVGRELRLLFSALGADEFYIHWSLDTLPQEFELSGYSNVGSAIARAVERRATLVYLHPGPQLVEGARSLGLPRVIDTAHFESLAQSLRDRVANQVQMSARDGMADRILTASFDEVLFAVPNQEFLYFGHRSESAYPHRLFVAQKVFIGTEEIPTLVTASMDTAITFRLTVAKALRASAHASLATWFG